MKKGKIFTILLTMMLTLCVCVGFVACQPPQEESQTGSQEQKYDVSIRIACDDGNTWVFTPDVEEIRIERNYDGNEHRYYVQAYQLPEHPRWGDKWISPSGEGANVFQASLAYRDENGKVSELKRVKERGEYCLNVYASHTSTLWNTRTVLLYITVK